MRPDISASRVILAYSRVQRATRPAGWAEIRSRTALTGMGAGTREAGVRGNDIERDAPLHPSIPCTLYVMIASRAARPRYIAPYSYFSSTGALK